MLLTGKYNFRNYFAWGVLNTDQLTIGNLLQDNGYKTYYAGKWQLDGGDASIKKFGFQHYIVWLPFKILESQAGSRYKSPHLYSAGNYIADSLMKNKYSEDVYIDSIQSFITRNAKNKFFVYYSMDLAHYPFSPTPGNPDYAAWVGSHLKHSDTKYFPDMINYMDKKIGGLVNFVKSKGLAKNTVIIYIGDNGKPTQIQSQYNGITITGQKDSTTTYGTHVPLIVYWPGTILPNSINNNLVCFPDFLPTLADLTHSTFSDEFKPSDGVSFYNQLFGNSTGARRYAFCSFINDTSIDKNPARWVQDTRYKLYDTLINNYHAPGFYDMQNDIEEHNPLPDGSLTPQQQNIQQNFRHILDSLK
jgi:arylsulfatase A-like enzyme